MTTIAFFSASFVFCVNCVHPELVKRLHPTGLDPQADFGSSVAVTSTFLAVGAQNNRNETGSVFIYSIEGNLLWHIQPIEMAKGANFGCALAACGNTLVVGAQYDGPNQSGSVAILEVNNSSGPKAAPPGVTILHSPAVSARFFGGSVKLHCSYDGSQTLVIGAAAGNGRGVVFRTRRGGPKESWLPSTAWTQLNGGQHLKAGANFGQAVGLGIHNLTLVGANHAHNTTGAVFMFDNPEGKQDLGVELDRPSGLTVGSFFGSSVAVSPSGLVACGAPWAYAGNGSVSLYSVNTGNRIRIAPLAEIPAPIGRSNFGITLEFVSEKLWIGAWSLDSVFEFDVSQPSNPRLLGTLTPPLAGNNVTKPIFFGSSLAGTAAGTVVVGASGDADDEGAAYLYERSSLIPTIRLSHGNIMPTIAVDADTRGFASQFI